MSEVKQVILKEADITNNCPECFNQNMKLTFYQKHINSRWFRQVTNEVTHQMVCNTCHSTIYPVKWTDDIERAFTYFQKMVIPEKKSTRLTPLSYSLIAFLLILTGLVYYLISSGIIEVSL